MEKRNIVCRTDPVQRSKGHSAVAGAAYRAGENLKARGQGPDGGDKWFRYSPKAIVVREAFILTPEGDIPDYVVDRAELWNRVEEMETHKNARLGRDLNLGLAYELSHEEQRALLVEFTHREIVDKGFVADVSIHNYGRTLPAIGGTEEQTAIIRGWAEKDTPFLSREESQGREDEHVMEMRNRDGVVTGFKLYQPHAHIRVTPRPIVDGEFAKDKYAGREFNKAETATKWRYQWPELQNSYLERAGSDVRVTSTSSDEDQFPGVRFSGDGQTNEVHNMVQRADAMQDASRNRHDSAQEWAAKDREFNDIHNAALQDAATDATASAHHDEANETARNAKWWRNMSARFHTWREDFAEKAEEWRERFRAQDWRLKSVLGSHDLDRDVPPPEQPEIAAPPQQEEPER